MPPITKTLPILLSLLGVACKPEDIFGVDGELGHDQFFYSCVETSDIQCLETDPSMPDVIAVGGRFRLDLNGGGFGGPPIEPAAPGLVTTTGNHEFEFAAPSTVAFLSFAGGKLSDFTHLTAVAPDSLRAMDLRGGSLQALRLEVGQEMTLGAAPFRDADALAGGFRYTWSSADARILQVPLQSSPTGTVRGRAVGATTLRIRTPLGLSTELQVIVGPATDAGAPGVPSTDSGLDSGLSEDASLDAGAVDAASPEPLDAAVVPTDAELPELQPDAASSPPDAASSTPASDASAADAGVNDGGSI